MLKQVFAVLFLSLSLIGCGGGSGGGSGPSEGNNSSGDNNSGNSDSSNNGSGSGSGNTNSGTGSDGNTGDSGSGSGSGTPSSQAAMKPSTSIKVGRDLKVLILSSHTNDRRALRQEEIDASFALVKEVLSYNQVINSYQLTYDEYDTSMSSQEMVKFYDDNASRSIYPEAYALAQSNWIKDQQNLTKLNNADIIVLRTSFNSVNTSGSFWGAAAGEAIIWPSLKNITGLNQQKVFLNSPTDPESSNFSYQHNDQLAEKLKISRFDRIFAHEFIHALGYGAHDNGVDVHQTETFSQRIKNDLSYAPTVGSTLSYGDCFSIMGNADCSLMLSPSAKEFLGVTLDFVPVYQSAKVQLKEGQLLKVFLSEQSVADGHEKVLNYITLEPPVTQDYGQTLNGDIDLTSETRSLQPNLNGYIVRLVTVNISIEGTPNVVLLDAAPPINNAAYTLLSGNAIEVGNTVKISFTGIANNNAEFDVTYL